MKPLACSVVTVSSEVELTSAVAAALGRLVGGGSVELLQEPPNALPQQCDVAFFVTSCAGFAATLKAVRDFISSAPCCSVLIAGSGLDGDQESALLAAGAADFISLPCQDGELTARLQRAQGLLPPPTLQLRPLLDARIKNVIGTSEAFATQLARLPFIAGCDASVLIHGETGTGKEICAQAIHYMSTRGSGPWVPVNCGAIPVALMESELFGHVRGAFTTANASRAGLVREAEGGTLLLDDIDCLSLDAQVKLLRFLQEREYRQLGSNAVCNANVRIIAASNQPLRRLAAEGLFRLDLYFRLNVLNLRLPPLRERLADIAPLASHFVREFAREYGRAANAISPAALRKLMAHAWPGNVRELRHVIERAVLLSRGPILSAEDMEIDDAPAPPTHAVSFRAAKARVIEDFERSLIEQLLAAHNGNVTGAAKAAHKNRRAFFALMRKYAIDAAAFRGTGI
jgi:two-component system response regulator GlrR